MSHRQRSDSGIIHIGQQYDRFENTFTLSSPYEAKEDVEQLDMYVTGRSWDPYYEAWTIKATRDSVRHASNYLESCGWQVVVDEPAQAVKRGEQL